MHTALPTAGMVTLLSGVAGSAWHVSNTTRPFIRVDHDATYHAAARSSTGLGPDRRLDSDLAEAQDHVNELTRTLRP